MGSQVESFVRRNPKFDEVVSQIFSSLEYNDRISCPDASRSVDILFVLISSHLDALGISVARPTKQEVLELFTATGYVNKTSGLDETEFKDFFAKVVIYAAKKAAVSFGQSYGIGIMTGIVSVMAIKGAIRSVPLVGFVSSPFLGLLPTLLIGPAIGIAVTYIIKKDGLEKLKEQIFGVDPNKPGQFRRG